MKTLQNAIAIYNGCFGKEFKAADCVDCKINGACYQMTKVLHRKEEVIKATVRQAIGQVLFDMGYLLK